MREIARLITVRGRTLIVIRKHDDGTYSYRGDGCGGSGLTLQRAREVVRECRDWPGGKTAGLIADAEFTR
jgi:hypothetical protein